MPSMKSVKIHEAKTQFSKLIALAEQGEEIIVQRGDVRVAKIVPYSEPARGRKAGALKGRITISDGFDEILEGFEDYTG